MTLIGWYAPLDGLEFNEGISPPEPVELGLVVVPDEDTIRGGAEVGIGGAVSLVDDADDRDLRSLVLPTGWTDASAGGTLTPTLDGLVFETSVTGATEALLESVATYTHLDVSVAVETFAPFADVDEEVQHAALELDVAGVVASIAVTKSARGGVTVLAQASGAYGLVQLTQRTTTLRIARTEETVGLWANETLLVSVADFPTAAGSVRLAVRNLAYAGVTRARLTDIEFSSNVLIDGKFITEHQVVSGRIFGLVPATSLTRRGLRDVRVFGTFGAETLTNGFLYTLPEPKTTGHARGEHLVTFIDPQLRDT